MYVERSFKEQNTKLYVDLRPGPRMFIYSYVTYKLFVVFIYVTLVYLIIICPISYIAFSLHVKLLSLFVICSLFKSVRRLFLSSVINT